MAKITAGPFIGAPQIGQIVTVYGRECKIIAIRPFGTVDVVTLEGDKAWRVSGLRFL